MATHSSTLPWRIPWTEELGGLQSAGHKESETTERLHFHYHFPRFHTVFHCSVAKSCLYDPMDCSLPGSSIHGDFPGKYTGVGCHALLQGIFPTQESNPGLLHCKRILYCLSHQESPRILEGQPNSFPGDLPDPGIELGSPALQVDSLPLEPLPHLKKLLPSPSS